MACVDELLARMLAKQRLADECAALMDGMAREESSEDEDEADDMWTVQDVYAKVCALEERLCGVEARLEEVAAAELYDEDCDEVMMGLFEIERVPMIEIDVVTAAATAAAVMFAREVTAELSAAAVVWWGGCDEQVAMGEEVVKFTDWMREWEAMVRWCGGGWWKRLLF